MLNVRFRYVMLLGLATIFVSIFFIFFIFDSFITISATEADLLIPLIFSLSMTATFVLVDLLVVHYMVKLVSLSSGFLGQPTVKDLEKKKKELESTKKEIERKFYNRGLDRQTFRSMMIDCERQITEIDVKIKDLRKSAR